MRVTLPSRLEKQVAHKGLDLRRYRRPDLPSLPARGANAAIKSLWVNRAARWISRQRDGIDTWQPDSGTPVEIKELVDAHITITTILDQDGNEVGLMAEFHMKEHGVRRHQHMGTFFYGPPRSTLGFVRKRQLVRTQYHM